MIKIYSIVNCFLYQIYKLAAKGLSPEAVEKIKEENSDILPAIDEIINSRVGNDNQYLPWIIREYRLGNSLNDIIPTLQYFHNNQHKLKQHEKNIDKYTAKELEDKIKELEGMSGKRQKAKEKIQKTDVEIFYKDEDYIIYQPKTKEEAKKVGIEIQGKYGVYPKWCILMDNSSYFKYYSAKNIVFYIAVSEKEVSNNLLGVAYSIVRDSETGKILEEYTESSSGFTKGIGIFDTFDGMRQNVDPLKYLEMVKRDSIKRPVTEYYKVSEKMKGLSKEEKYKFLRSENSYEVEAVLQNYNLSNLKEEDTRHLLRSKDNVINALILNKFGNEPNESEVNRYKEELKNLVKRNNINSEKSAYLLIKSNELSSQEIEQLQNNKYFNEILNKILIFGKDYDATKRENRYEILSEDVGKITSSDGGEFWYKNGEFHREDGPAVEYPSGNKYWYINGKRHREDGPAIEVNHGPKEWYKNDQLHREDGPAVEWPNGDKYWYINGLKHREDGPAIKYADGREEWYKDGMLHREDGPATESTEGSKFWYLNGKCHRENGPAIEWADGSKEWYINNKQHREDGPAYEGINGDKFWYKDGQLHRENGPAKEYANGDKQWWINGKLHRETGPAREYVDGDKDWWINGKRVEEKDLYTSKMDLITISKRKESRWLATRIGGKKASLIRPWPKMPEQVTLSDMKEILRQYALKLLNDDRNLLIRYDDIYNDGIDIMVNKYEKTSSFFNKLLKTAINLQAKYCSL